MSLEKAIKHGKEKRKPYYGAKAVDSSCARGDCPWCKGNKLHKHRRRGIQDQAKLVNIGISTGISTEDNHERARSRFLV